MGRFGSIRETLQQLGCVFTCMQQRSFAKGLPRSGFEVLATIRLHRVVDSTQAPSVSSRYVLDILIFMNCCKCVIKNAAMEAGPFVESYML